MVTAKNKSASSAPIDGFDADELLALALLDMEKGDFSHALGKLKNAAAAETQPAETFSTLAKLYAQLRLWNRAQEMYEKYLLLEPKAITETFQLGMVHYDAGRPQEALKIWDRQLGANPTFPPALFYRALILAQTNQLAPARQTLDTLLKSVATDNLYFGRAKELLQSLDRQAQAPASTNVDTQALLAKDAYKTEH